MNAYEVYNQYIALKSHFTTQYDYIKYRGKLGLTVESFERRHDKPLFKRLSKHKDPLNYIIANLLEDKTYLVDFSEDVYLAYLKRRESLMYLFQRTLKQEMLVDFNSNFAIKDDGTCHLLHKYFMREISHEDIVILDTLTECLKYWADNTKKLDSLYEPFYKDCINKAMKYRPFLRIDKDRFRQVVLKYYQSSNT